MRLIIILGRNSGVTIHLAMAFHQAAKSRLINSHAMSRNLSRPTSISKSPRQKQNTLPQSLEQHQSNLDARRRIPKSHQDARPAQRIIRKLIGYPLIRKPQPAPRPHKYSSPPLAATAFSGLPIGRIPGGGGGAIRGRRAPAQWENKRRH